MKSRISIDFREVLFGKLEPVINCTVVDSDDMKDKMLRRLFELSNGYLKIEYNGECSTDGKVTSTIYLKSNDNERLFDSREVYLLISKALGLSQNVQFEKRDVPISNEEMVDMICHLIEKSKGCKEKQSVSSSC